MSRQIAILQPPPKQLPPRPKATKRAIGIVAILTAVAGCLAVLGNLAQISQWWLMYKRPSLTITELWGHSPPPTSETTYNCDGDLCRVQYVTFFSIQNPASQAVQVNDISLLIPKATISYSLQQDSPAVIRPVTSIAVLQDHDFDYRHFMSSSEVYQPRIIAPSGETILAAQFGFAILKEGQPVRFHAPPDALNPYLHAMFGLPFNGGDKAIATYTYVFRTNHGRYSIASRAPRLFIGHLAIPELVCGPKPTCKPSASPSPPRSLTMGTLDRLRSPAR
jgi:hypothetical protein